MRLIIKITIIYALIAFFVFLIGGYINYTVMSREIDKEQRFFLNDRLKHTVTWIEKRNLDKPFERNKLKITPLPELVEETNNIYSDTLALHEDLQRIEPHIKLDVIKNINGRSYKIMLYDLIIESDDIEDVVKETMLKTYLILLLAMLLISFVVSYYLFKPFHETLLAIKLFSIRSHKKIILNKPSTAEFKKLNYFIEDMTNQVITDYRALKEFSENASHEIQTPLSIADGKLELLLGFPNLEKEQLELITSARSALRRLSKTSNSLSLLTKIENREFTDFEQIDIAGLVSDIVGEFSELILLKSINLELQLDQHVILNGNRVLLELLVSNLLNNAVRHNHADGFIRVTLSKEKLIVENSGQELAINPQLLFQRFRKGSDHPESSGLGLSIVQLISKQHGFDVNYQEVDKHHTLIVSYYKAG